LNEENWDGRGRLKNGCRGPILLYTGNEGPIDAFWEANGFMINVLAPKWGALLLFPEERYYGKSLPFGPSSFESANFVYLTTEQVIEDYVELLSHIKSTKLGAANCPVVAFGGSYGGTLTTFLRVSHPEAVVGALASSAPIGYYDRDAWEAHGVDAFTWSDIVTRDYDEAHPACLRAIHEATSAIDAYGATDMDGLLDIFNVCTPSALGPNRPSELFQYALESLPQLDYPYPVGGRPAWPVNYTCEALVAAANSGKASSPPLPLIEAAAHITKMAMGTEGSSDCMQALVEGPGGIPGDGPGPNSWGWQSCTENLHQFSARGVRNYSFSLADSAEKPCSRIFNGRAVLNTTRLTQLYGGFKLGDGLIANVSNIIWSNGALDPWSGGGFIAKSKDVISDYDERRGLYWIFLKKGAHHLDLRGPHPDDPEEVTDARNREEAIIYDWILEAATAT